MKIPKNAERLIGKIVNGVTSAVSQTSAEADQSEYPTIEGIGECCREAAAESFVLLKNEGNILPFSPDEKIAVFGRVQYDTFFVGYGSGGDVNPHYTVSINEGIKNCGRIRIDEALDKQYRQWTKKNPADNGFWGHWPMSHDEMHVNEAIAAQAAERSDKALIVIGRAAGEDRENKLIRGSYYLTEEEENMIAVVRRHFPGTAVLLNIGGIMDMNWIRTYDIPCVGVCWQGGMETGNAVARILCGELSPSGKLPDTVAVSYDAYPSSDNFGGKKKNHYEEDIFVGYRYFETFDKDAVLFPFGHGLSYSEFSLSELSFQRGENETRVDAKLTNTGLTPAKSAVFLFYSIDGSLLPVPLRQLAGFKKSDILSPGESVDISFQIPDELIASYDDTGITGRLHSKVLPAGKYGFHIGFSVRDTNPVGEFVLSETKLIEKLESHAAPKAEERLMRLTPLNVEGRICRTYEPAPTDTGDLRDRILMNLPAELQKSDKILKLRDAEGDSAALDAFISTLTDDELEAITRGDYIMNSPLGPKGNAGVFGGVLPSLREKGVVPITTTDGPSGIRLAARSALLPCGTAFAASFNTELTEKTYSLLGREMADRGSDVLLAPGMNIHRDPLCGRNFEYFSEDPLVAGKFAAAVVRGLRQSGVFGCPKHFACNNQETNRIRNDSVLSERALREIYLKGFEICVKEASPDVLMTSYNKINGVWGHYHFALVTEILRKEWGYDGVVITDWWMRKSASPEFPALRDQAYRVRAGVDVLMPGGERTGKRVPDGTLLETLGQKDGITRGELQEAAKHVLKFVMKTAKYQKEKEKETNENNEL